MFKVLVARITVFFLTCIWVLGLLFGGVVFFPTVQYQIQTHVAVPALVWFLIFWYIATIVLVGVWIAIKGFRFVGKWERNEG